MGEDEGTASFSSSFAADSSDAPQRSEPAPSRLAQFEPRPTPPVTDEEARANGIDDVLAQRFTNKKGKTICVVYLHSARWIAADYSHANMLREASRLDANILVRRMPSKHVIVLFRNCDINAILLTALLREDELGLHTNRNAEPFDKYLWRWNPVKRLLMNGLFKEDVSPGMVKHAPTRIPMDWIRQKIRYVADPKAFAKDREGDCLRGQCTSSLSDMCPLWKHHFEQCQMPGHFLAHKLDPRDNS